MAKRNSTAPHGAKVLPFQPKVIDREVGFQVGTVEGLRDLADELSQESGVQGAIILIERKGRPLELQATGHFALSDDKRIIALLKSLHVSLHQAG